MIALLAMLALLPPEEIAVPPAPEVPVIADPPPAPLIVPPPLLLAPPRPGLPDALKAMIDAAYRTGDEKTIEGVLGLAKANFPEQIAAINASSAANATVLADKRKDALAREQQRIAEARFFEIWKGHVELGATRSTGSTRAVGVYAAAQLTRDGIHWKQNFNGRVDYQQTNGVPTTDRYLLAYQPDYKLDERWYVYGLAQYEHDRFLGYTSRGTLGTGIGYSAFIRSNLKGEFELGPALRHTDYVGLPTETRAAGRASLNLRWSITPTLDFTQTSSIFFESDDATVSSVTALDTKLIGQLKARFSYNLQYERQTVDATRQLDTLTRATLVYDF